MSEYIPPTRSRRPTLRLSEQGRVLIEAARQEKGWTVDDRRWLKAAHQKCQPEPTTGWAKYWQENDSTSPSEVTLKRFRKRAYIDRQLFVALCEGVGVGLDNVVDLDRQHPSAIGDFPTDLADAPFYGRAKVLTQLTEWMGDRQCRLVWVQGRAGMGKTSLGCRAVRQMGGQFDFTIWLSLESAPLLSEVLSQLLPYFPDAHGTTDPRSSLLKCFKQFRCLVIFDQWETIAPQPGKYRPGYEDYGDAIESLCRNHQSCVAILSRMGLELPESAAVRSLKLEDLRYPEDREFLQGLSGTEAELQSFLQVYNNPLILRLAARTVIEILGGNVSPLVQTGVSVYGANDVERIMSKEFQYLSGLEENLIYWLAIWQDPVSYDRLANSLNIGFADFLNTLDCLTRKRSLVKVCTDEDGSDRNFSLDRLTLKYVTLEFVRRNVKELVLAIKNRQFQPHDLIVTHALTIGTPALNQQQQRRMIRPIVESLQEKLPHEWRQNLAALRTDAAVGYTMENLDRILE
jgi:NB-ARC domain